MKIEKLFTQIAKVAKKTSTDVYVVGGYVRDCLLGEKENKDIDFVVNGSGLEFARAFAKDFSETEGRLIEFPDFDTARFIFFKKGKEKKEIELEIEFAGARSEQYEEGSRKPAVKKATIEEDLSRRDFTINAMAQQILPNGELGEIIDPYLGRRDLEERIIRTPLDPDQTFSDDPLRMMRAIRFAGRLNFAIGPNTLAAIERNRERLKIVSAERLQEEFLQILALKVPSESLRLLYLTGLFDEFIPEVPELAGVEEIFGYKHKDNLSHTFAVVDNIAQYSDNVILRFAGLLHDIAKPRTKKYVRGRGWTFDMHEHLGRKMVREIGRRLRMSVDDTEYMAKLVRWHLQPIALMDRGVTDSAVRRLITNLGDDLHDLLILCRADITTGNQRKKEQRLKNYEYIDKRIDEVTEKDKLRAFQSPIRGEEIMKVCGLKPGLTVGAIKSAIEDAIIEGKIPNEYEAAREYFMKIKDEYLEKAGEWEKRRKA